METYQKSSQNVKYLYIYRCLFFTIFFAPIIALFLQDIGLSLLQIGIVQTVFGITIVALEVPTGYFSDRFGRILTLRCAAIVLVVGVFVYGMSTSFVMVLFAELLWALGISLVSGTDSALLYDSLLQEKKEKEYKKVWGDIGFISLIGAGIAQVIGGFIGNWDFRFTFWLSIPFYCGMFYLTFRMKEPRKHKKQVEKDHFKVIWNVIKSVFVVNRKLRALLLFAGILYGFFQAGFIYYQPYLKLSQVPLVYFGIVFASFQIVTGLSSKYAHVIDKKIGINATLGMFLVLLVTSYLLMGYFSALFSFVIIYLHQIIRGMERIVISDAVNAMISSEHRATILSIKNMVGRFFFALVGPFIGWFADVYSLSFAFTISGITAFVCCGIFYVILITQRDSTKII